MNIKELRNQLKLSQSAFAEKIGVDRSTVGHMENGRLAVSDKVADKIWEVFGVEIRDTKEKKPAKKAKAPKLVNLGRQSIKLYQYSVLKTRSSGSTAMILTSMP